MPGLDRDREVGEHRQRERPHPDEAIGPALLPELGDLAPLAHVVGDDEQDRGEHRHRHERGQRRREQQDQQQRARRESSRRPASRPPERTLVAVRAIAPVAGRPPTSGDTMLAMPCANSSTFELCRRPLIRSATTADSSDSIAPSIATVSVGDSSVRIRSGRKRGNVHSGRPDGMPPKRVPIVSSGKLRDGDDDRSGDERDDVAGHARHQPVPDDDQHEHADAHDRRRNGRVAEVRRARTLMRADELARHRLIERDPEEVLELRAGDDERDAVGEADDDRARDEPDGGAGAGEPHDDEHDAGHHRAHEQAVDAVLGDDARDDHDERAGRSADLHVRAAERRDEEAGDDRAVDAGLRRHARGDRERHRQRQRDEADGDAGDQIGRERAKRSSGAAPGSTPAGSQTGGFGVWDNERVRPSLF